MGLSTDSQVSDRTKQYESLVTSKCFAYGSQCGLRYGLQFRKTNFLRALPSTVCGPQKESCHNAAVSFERTDRAWFNLNPHKILRNLFWDRRCSDCVRFTFQTSVFFQPNKWFVSDSRPDYNNKLKRTIWTPLRVPKSKQQLIAQKPFGRVIKRGLRENSAGLG